MRLLRFTLQLGLVAFLTLGLLETVVRVLRDTPENGQEAISILGVRLRLPPFPNPVSKLQEPDSTHLTGKSLGIYDPHLGYTYRPNFSDEKLQMSHNSQSIRVDNPEKAYPEHPTVGTLRIAIFGDSFSHGDGSSYQNSWGNQLEKELNLSGINAEVLNFGVGGYAQDQALLRYLRQGIKFHPHVVIFGFSIENIRRNLYLFRYFYKKGSTGIPVSKPRFILDGETLVLVNSPTPPPEALPEIFKDFKNWPLARYETFYHEDDYEPRLWHKSRFISLLVALYREYQISRMDDYPNGSGYLLSQAIIKHFADEAARHQSRFLIVHLPPGNYFPHYVDNGTFKYESHLEVMESKYSLVRPEQDMLAGVTKDTVDLLFADHYSALGHQIIGKSVAKYIINDPSLRPH